MDLSGIGIVLICSALICNGRLGQYLHASQRTLAAVVLLLAFASLHLRWFDQIDQTSNIDLRSPIDQAATIDVERDHNPGGLEAVSPLPVLWMAPFFSGGGYCSEAISFAMSLSTIPGLAVAIAHHGDSFNQRFVSGLDSATAAVLNRQAQNQRTRSHEPAVIICHSEPGAWFPPRYSTSHCPPGPDHYSEDRIVIGRTMFETDRLPEGWAERLNKMDYVWVPTKFHLDVFAAGGVARAKLVVVPEAVDTDFFTPDVEPMVYPAVEGYEASSTFNFLSIFKWEERKGWKFLLEAFLREFTAEDRVVLWILTNAYHTANDFQSKIDEYVRDVLQLSLEAGSHLPPVRLLPEGLPTARMPNLYKGADAFVIASRGEGWGRPHCEAMSMGLPVIATHWSGPVEYMSEQNSYPLRIDGLEPMNNENFPGHNWAKPSVSHLRELMRRVVQQPSEAQSRGSQARKDMVAKYCPACLAKIVMKEFAKFQTSELDAKV